MSELFRVLKKGGTLIAQVPLEENRSKTFEDPSIQDKKKRTEVFGQYDHVRLYGMDYFERLKNIGFQAEAVDFIRELSEEDILRYALPEREFIPVAKK